VTSVGSAIIDTVADPFGLPISAAVVLGDLILGLTPIGQAPVLVEGPGGRTSRLARTLCRYSAGAVEGYGWAEWLG
jgi:hypothetical protein